MARRSISAGPRIRLAGRLAVSAAILAVFLGLIRHAGAVLQFFVMPRPPSAYSESPPATGGSDESARLPVHWPKYPGARGHPVTGMSLNGVPTLCEDWEATASAQDILDYYRGQMAARGWSDVTDTYLIRADGNEAAWDRLEYPEAMEEYVAKMDNTLTLRREDWTLHLVAGPGSRPWKSAVRILAAQTLDIQAVMQTLREGGAFVAEENLADGTYRTTLVRSRLDATAAIDARMKEMGVSQWRRIESPRLSPRTMVAMGSTPDESARVYAVARDGRDPNTLDIVTTEVRSHE
jgi:hypothetical protein